ncbi:metallophosphoesterase [Bacillus mycoides]|uniref:metallophosphoesterase n=1 Tax=Bacillus mycoides TaxID=1405 RepID=UPI003D086E2C
MNNYTEDVASGNRNRPAAVIVNGDITAFGHNHIGSPERQWDMMTGTSALNRGLFGILARPLYFGLGNHDLDTRCGITSENYCFNSSLENLERHIRNHNLIADFHRQSGITGRTVGSFAYVVNFGRICSIQLNDFPTFNRMSSTHHIHENFDWLRNRLQVARNSGQIIIINIHQPFHSSLTPRYRDLFQEFGVLAIFGGHWHGSVGHVGSVGNIPVFLSGGASQRTYLILEHYQDRFEIFSVRCNDWRRERQLVRTIPIPTSQPHINGRFQIATALDTFRVVDYDHRDRNHNVHLWHDLRNAAATHTQQLWNISYDPQRDAHVIRNQRDQNRVLSVDLTTSTSVFAYPFGPFEDQYWIIEPNQGGYIFRNLQNRNLVLDVYRSRTANGTNILVHPFSNTTNQRFVLRRA